jgi:AraC-like DNA-binding protein
MNISESTTGVEMRNGAADINVLPVTTRLLVNDGSRDRGIRALLEQALMHWDYDAAQTCLLRARVLVGREAGRGRPSGPGPRRPYLDAYIDSHLDSRIRIRDFAALMRLSSCNVHRLFQRCFGASPMSYVTLRRIQRAQTLMRSPDKRLAEIALACGFFDQAHFSRVFKRLVGTSPRRWRQEYLSADYVNASSGAHVSRSPIAHAESALGACEATFA